MALAELPQHSDFCVRVLLFAIKHRIGSHLRQFPGNHITCIEVLSLPFDNAGMFFYVALTVLRISLVAFNFIGKYLLSHRLQVRL